MEAALLSPSGRTVLESAVVAIGRTADNQFVVNDASVSSHHAEMRLLVQGYSIIDLSSANGTFVNEQRLDSDVPCPLNAGDMIRLGDATFRYAVSDVSPVTSGVSATLSQVSNPAVVETPFEFTVYGPAVQEEYQYPPRSAVSYYAAPVATQSNAPPEAPSGAPVYDAVAPPPFYTLPPTKRKSGGGMRILLVILAAILVLIGVGGGGIAVYILTRPQPVISITSDYHVGSTPAGSTGTVFHVSGHKFFDNSVITFLLDGSRAPGDSGVASDANGNVKMDLTVTSDWAVGNHTLTARDANGNITKGTVSVKIVAQGQAHTPGPNGAPADDTSFTISVTIHGKVVATGQPFSFTESLIVTGRPDPAGGTVCQYTDNGQPQTYQGNAGNGITYTETTTYTCSGTYKGGKLSYTETATSDKASTSNGITCVQNSPSVFQHLEGAFNASNSISGTLSGDNSTATCNKGIGTVKLNNAVNGTWTGQV